MTEFVILIRKHSLKEQMLEFARVKLKILIWIALPSKTKKLFTYLYWISKLSINKTPDEFNEPITIGKSKRESRTYLT